MVTAEACDHRFCACEDFLVIVNADVLELASVLEGVRVPPAAFLFRQCEQVTVAVVVAKVSRICVGNFGDGHSAEKHVIKFTTFEEGNRFVHILEITTRNEALHEHADVLVAIVNHYFAGNWLVLDLLVEVHRSVLQLLSPIIHGLLLIIIALKLSNSL